MFRRRQLAMPYVDMDQFLTCSETTQKLAEIYAWSYAIGYCCDDRPMNFYPLLDRIVEWMDETYAP